MYWITSHWNSMWKFKGLKYMLLPPGGGISPLWKWFRISFSKEEFIVYRNTQRMPHASANVLQSSTIQNLYLLLASE
jgi:hypothetical protein